MGVVVADLQDALLRCVEESGIPPKQIAFQMNIDLGHLSKMLHKSPNDARHFPPERIAELMDICRNEFPLEWLAENRGYILVRTQHRVEQECRQLQKRVEELETTVKVLTGFKP